MTGTVPGPVFTPELFSPHLGTVFTASWPEGTAELRLVAVDVVPGEGRHRSFSMEFEGSGATFLPQRIYRLEHDDVPGMDLFLVPIGERAGGYVYQAVFTSLD